MLKGNKWILILGMTCICRMAHAQFDTQSPYSYYGIGIPVNNQLQNGFAMGGVTHALRDSLFANWYNPAALTSMDVTQLVFGFEGNFLTRKESTGNYSNNNLYIDQFGLGIPVIHRNKIINWGMFLGYAPYSNVGYKLNDSSQVIINTDTMTAQSEYLGAGGLNRITWGNAIQLGKNFSIGVNMQYLFGTSRRTRTLELPYTEGYLSSRVDEKTVVNAFSFDLGFQTYFNIKAPKYKDKKRFKVKYYRPNDTTAYYRDSVRVDSMREIAKDRKFRVVIGGTYNYGGSFDAKFSQTGIQYFGGNFDASLDTFLLSPDGTGQMTLPHAFGGGISFGNPGVWTVSADYNYKQWSGFYYFDQPTLQLYDSYSLHLGGEYCPIHNDRFKKQILFRNIIYRGGVRYYNRYYRPDANPVEEIAFSFGLGLPFGFNRTYDEDHGGLKTILSYINVGVEAGFANSRTTNIVNESFVRFTMAVTLRDKWFIKRKYY